MFKKDRAIHEKIYADIVSNYRYRDGASFGEMEKEIDEIYRQKVDAYGLSEKGYYNDDPSTEGSKFLDEFFEKKLNGTLEPTFTVTRG